MLTSFLLSQVVLCYSPLLLSLVAAGTNWFSATLAHIAQVQTKLRTRGALGATSLHTPALPPEVNVNETLKRD